MIVLYRVDDRLIHGQTMINLIPKIKCDGIIIVNDEVAKNPNMKSIYSSVIPSNIKLLTFDLQKAMKKLPEAQASQKRYYVIVKSILDFEKLYDQGFKVDDTITVGCVSRKEGSVVISNGFFLLQDEIKAYQKLDEVGYDFSIMTMASKFPASWKDYKNKIEVKGD